MIEYPARTPTNTAISTATKVNVLFYGIRSQSQLPDHLLKGAEYAVATISMEGLTWPGFLL